MDTEIPSSTTPHLVTQTLEVAIPPEVRRVDASEATALWGALIEGKWSIVEATEANGKRFLLARRMRDDAYTGDTRALTAQESSVVWLASEGRSLKFIGFELGMSIPIVARRLRTAMRKLGVASRRDLLRKLGVPPTQ